MKKRLLASLLAICLVMSLLPTIAMAEEDVLASPDTYTDVTLRDAVAYLDGSGTEEDPFQIWNADDLYYINYIEYWNGLEDEPQVYCYQQMQDLDLSGASQFGKETGYITANFGGVYDGGGYAITGMRKSLFYFTRGSYIGDNAGTVFTDYISGESHDQVFSAIVRNLVIDSPDITQAVATDVIEQLGAVAAYAVNTTFYDIEVRGGQINGVSGAAAIAGRAGSVVIDHCSSDTDIYASMHRAAGIVANLRIVDEKKGATATSLVTNCTFSGSISGNLDGERGSAGIVGAVYMDGESELDGGNGLPLYLTDCTFSGSITATVTSGSGNVGGILGTSYLGPGLYLKGNTVTGTIEGVTAAPGATAANVGGVVGKMLNYSLLDSNLTLTLEDNDTSRAVLPVSDPESRLYVGTVVGCQNDPNRAITGPVSISTADTLGEYGNIQGAQLAGAVGDLVLPACTGGVQLYILEGAQVGDLTVNTDSSLSIYNYGTVGNVTSRMGVNVYANSGVMGSVTSENGAVTVGGSSKAADTAGAQTGNEGTMGDLAAASSVTVYRNTGAIGDVSAATGAVSIGQGNSSTAGVKAYNVNSGTVGSVTAGTSVSVQSGEVASGSVAAGEGQSITAGTSVSIGASGYPNKNAVGNITAGTTVSVYNAADTSVGDIEAGGNVTIGASTYLNQGNVGDLTSTGGSVTIYSDAGVSAGDVDAKGAVTIGATTALNQSLVGSVASEGEVKIYNGEAGTVAAGEAETVTAGSTVTIGASTAANEGAVGPIETTGGVNLYNGGATIGAIQAGGTVNLYGNGGTIGNVTSTGSIAVGGNNKTESNAAGQVGNTGIIGNLTGTAVSIYRNTNTIGAVEATTGAVVIGNGNSSTEAIRTFNVNAGTIGNVEAATTVTVYSGDVENGSVATGTDEVITAGGNVTIGATAYLNRNDLGPITSTGGSVTIYSDEASQGSVTAGTSVTIGAATAPNQSEISAVTAGTTVTIYGGEEGSVGNVKAEGTVTIGSTTAPNQSSVGAVTAPTVTGYTTAAVGTITADSNKLVNATGEADSQVITVSANATLTADEDGNISVDGSSVTYPAGSKLVLTKAATITISGDKEVKLSAVESNGNLTLLDAGGKAVIDSIRVIGNLTLGSSSAYFAGTVSGDLSASGNVTVYNSGTVGTEEGDSVISVDTGSITITNGKSGTTPVTGTIHSDVVNNSAASTTSITNNASPMAGSITQKGSGVLTLSGSTTSGRLYTGTISVAKALTVGNNIGVNGAGDAISVIFTGESGVISVANHAFYLQVTGSEQLASLSVSSTASTDKKNTVDLSGLSSSVQISTAVNAGKTEVILPEGTFADSYGTLVSGTVAADQTSNTYATGSLVVSDGVSLSADGTLTVTASTATITNYGTIGAINHIGTGTLTIYNIGSNAKIGNVTSTGAVTVGGSNKTASNAGTAVGNEGTMGSITAASSVTVYRNTGAIGDVSAATGAISIGQGNSSTAGVKAYNVNSGTVGSVTAGTSVSVQSGEVASGSVAAGEGQSISAGTSVSIGASGYPNKNTVGNVTAGTTVSVYNAADTSVGDIEAGGNVTIGASTYLNQGNVGDLTSTGGSVTIYSDAGVSAGDVDAATTVAIGSATVLNQSSVGSVQAGSTVTIYNGEAGTVAAGEAETVTAGTSVTIGSKTAPNAGKVGAVQAGSGVTIVNAATGSAGSVNAGSTVTIGDAACANAGGVGAVTTTGGVNIYNGSAAIGNIQAGSTVYLYANAGTMGTVASTAGSITVGGSGKTSDTSAAGQIGNTGSIGTLTGTSVTVYRNTGSISAIESTVTGITIGQGNSTTAGVAAYNVNAGTIGSVKAATSISLHSGDVEGGSVAAGTGETFEAGTSITIGASSGANCNTVGDVTTGGSVTIINAAKGSVGSVNADTSVTIGASTLANAGSVGAVTAGSSVSVYNGEVQLSTINAGSTVYLYANSGKIGDVTSTAGSIQVGGSGKTEGTAAGQVGNSGTIGDMEGTAVTVYRNTAGAQIGSLTATTGNVTIGQSNSTTEGVPSYNQNAGTIGSVDAKASVSIYSTGTGSVAAGSGESVKAGSSVTIGTKDIANENTVGAVTCGTSVNFYNGSGTVRSITAGTSITAYITEGSANANLTTGTGDVTIYDQTISQAPSVNVTTDGGDVKVSRVEGDTNPILVKVNLTVTDKLTAGQTLLIRGTFASVVHKGAGDVIMESADTVVTNVVEQGAGEVKNFGSAGTVVKPDDGTADVRYLLTLVPVSANQLEVYLLTTDGSALGAGQVALTADGGTFTAETGAVKGGGGSEKVGTVAVNTASAQTVTVTVGGSFTPTGGAAVALNNATYQLVIPAAIERVDTVFLTSEEAFNAAKAQYGWDDTVAAPTAYPVLAVMPVVSEAYDTVAVQVNGTAVTDGVALVSVDKAAALEAGSVTVGVTASGTGVPAYSEDVTYTLTEADKAQLDTETQYYYVTFRYMDGQTADQVVPVVQGRSIRLEAATGRTGYRFLGWHDGTTLYTAGTYFTPAADTVFTAQWSADSATHTLYLRVSGSGSVVRVVGDTEYPITSGTNFREGETVTLRAKRNARYSFTAWNINGQRRYDETVTITMTSDQYVTATFSRVSSGSSTATYGVSVGSVENGTVSVSPTRASSGAQVTITVKPDDGYELGSLRVETASGKTVKVSDEGRNTYVFTMPDEAVRVIAAFVKASQANPFTDVHKSDYFYDAVLWAVAEDVTYGTSATTFSPDATVSRAQLVTFLWRAHGAPVATGDNPFTDVSQSDYFYDAVLWAVANGITNGTSATTFSPDAPVTRAQAVTFQWRAAGEPEVSGSRFDDVAADAYYAGAVSWAVQAGITVGTGNNNFSPDAPVSRAQAVTFLYRERN